jgi:hypothetical protein
MTDERFARGDQVSWRSHGETVEGVVLDALRKR